jgi:hypothetical protein
MRISFGTLIGLSIGLALPGAIATHSARAQANDAPQAISYVPPMRGAPDARISGATRGRTDEPVRLDVIAPSHVGRTLQAQPTLYWFNSRPITHDVEITIVADESSKTVLDTTIHGPIPAGIHAFRLAGSTTKLDPQVVYQWTVTDRISDKEPSQDIVASGMIERFPASALTEPLPPSPVAAAGALARAGIWYDALAALGNEIDQKPADTSLRQVRATLLAQAGLTDAASFDAPAKN